MSMLRRAVQFCLLVGILTIAANASAASASTFFVNGATGNDANPCTEPAAPCKTIMAAVKKSETTPGTATIEVAAGTYHELVSLTKAADNGLAINGVGAATKIEGESGATKPTVTLGPPGSSETVSNLLVLNPAGDEEPGIGALGAATLNNVSVDIQSLKGIGIASETFGAITVNGGGVTMESGAEGDGIEVAVGGLSVNGTTITLNDGATGSAIMGEFGPFTLTNVTVNLGNKASGGVETEFSAVTLTNLVVKSHNGTGLALLDPSNVSADGVNVMMENAASSASGVTWSFGGGTIEHLQVSGSWKGPSFVSQNADATLTDSRLINGPLSTAPALVDQEMSEGRGLLVQRSVLQAPATAGPGTLLVFGGNATIDSSEILGGVNGAAFLHGEGKTRTLTIAGSTVDAGALGVRDGGSTSGVIVEVGEKGSVADVNVRGSIVFEPQKAFVGPGGNAATINCSYSDVPNQNLPATATEGAIACGSGTGGNTTTEPLTALFSSPITNYAPLLGSSAIDSVPVGAISLPFGLTPSMTDLAGNPRVVDGNGDCLALEDRGAVELQGHSAPCPPVAKPIAGVISGLTISPSSFLAAPSGATISKRKKKTYGATISYKDSQVATTTLTVLKPSSGRTQGKSCKKPSKANKHGKHCTIYTAIGSFTHADTAGANKLHFSGRLKSKKLGKGSYLLQAVAHNAAGNGKAVSKGFKIK